MIVIRRVRETDALQIAGLLNEIIADGTLTVMTGAIAPEEQRAFIRGFPATGIFHAATGPDGRILGIQDIMPAAVAGIGEISTFVRLDSRGRGIGRSLTEATLEAASRMGFGTIRAIVRSDNARAVAFYRGQGFEPAGAIARYARIGGHELNGVLLARSL